MDVQVQVAAARTHVLAVPVPDRVTLEVTGHDRVTWLNGLVTCDLGKLPADEARYGLFVARSGRVLADALIAADDVGVLVSVPGAVARTLLEHLDHYRVMEDAELVDRTNEMAAWEVHGPRAAEVLAEARSAGARGGLIDRTELGGAILFLQRDAAPDPRTVVADAVARARGALGDQAGWQALRLERGVPEFGADFGETTYPQEAGLEKIAVSFQKGCYLGQEVVCMLEMRGHVKRRLASLVLDAGSPPPIHAAVVDDAGEPSGEVTSACYSPTLGRPVALAMLKRAAAEVGRVVTVGSIRAEVVRRPA
ncbi:MAG TPA: glycine cleavage T C-terminal barrel domain-containing protein [Polyangiaceae bacterium]|nr:glycine cleavage T C-terminal barrel domain-containing protein [Polyangiaceae bacterium]